MVFGSQLSFNSTINLANGNGLVKVESGPTASSKQNQNTSSNETFHKFKDSPPDHPDYTPPKNWNGKTVNSSRGRGYPDKKGKVWVPDNHGGTHANHWDVQPSKDPGYTTVYSVKI